MTKYILGLSILAAVSACADTTDRTIEKALAGESQVSGARLGRALDSAGGRPLGSQRNPVRAEFPMGERAYLARLRCSDGKAPSFVREGSFGDGPYGNILDGYNVDCGAAAPGRVQIFMDMYHRGYVEARSVPGFTLAPAN